MSVFAKNHTKKKSRCILTLNMNSKSEGDIVPKLKMENRSEGQLAKSSRSSNKQKKYIFFKMNPCILFF